MSRRTEPPVILGPSGLPGPCGPADTPGHADGAHEPACGPELDRDPGGALHALLAEPLAQALPASSARQLPAALRQRLQARVSASVAAQAGMVTRRLASTPVQTLAPGVDARALYRAPADRPPRPGEPWRAWLLDLAPGATLTPAVLIDGPAPVAAPLLLREWLLLSGSVQTDGLALAALDHHTRAPGLPSPAWTAPAGGTGARLFYREACMAAPAAVASTVRDADAGWPAYAPGIRRRVLWQHGGQAALLYRVDAGASVPLHGHGHDEECLMVEGDVFLDDWLLRAGDYQLAPAGTQHVLTQTDTGGVLYAHGDLDLRFIG